MLKKALAALSVAVMLCAAAIPSQAADGSELKNIIIQKEPGRLAVTLQTDEAVVYESFTLMGPNRLIFDLQNMGSFTVEPLIAVNHLGIISVRTAQNRPDVVRIVFDFDAAIPPYSIGDSPEGIIVTFREPDPEPKPEPARPVEPEVEKKTEPAAVKPAPKKPAPAKTVTPARKAKAAPAPGKGRMLAAGLQAGLYLMQDADFQDLYGKSAMFFGIEGTYFFNLNSEESIGVGLDAKMINAEGKTSYLEEDIKLRLIPFSLSASYMRSFGKIMPYAALGVDILSYRETYPADFAVPEVSGTTLGVNIALGAYAAVAENILLKAFVKLHSLKANVEEDLSVNFGGTELGVSVCYRFNF